MPTDGDKILSISSDYIDYINSSIASNNLCVTNRLDDIIGYVDAAISQEELNHNTACEVVSNNGTLKEAIMNYIKAGRVKNIKMEGCGIYVLFTDNSFLPISYDSKEECERNYKELVVLMKID